MQEKKPALDDFVGLRLLQMYGVLFAALCLWFSSSCGYAQESRPQLLLLKEYKEGQKLDGWVMSEKLDGVRAYWNGRQLFSRNGHLFAAPDWFIADFPPFELDGELWMEREAFAQTLAIVRRAKPHLGWSDLTYQIFEVPQQPGGLMARLDKLRDYLGDYPNPYLRIIEQSPVESVVNLHKVHSRIIKIGGEGLVLRDPDALYHSGRSSLALKLKQRQDGECRVVGYTQGRGRFSGGIGALICEIVPGQFSHLSADMRKIKIGSGLNHGERQNPPAMGSTLTFQYMGLTRRGLPRFPVYLRVRMDSNNY